METHKQTYRLKIPGETENLELIRSFVSHIAQMGGFDEDDIYKIELAVDEACANVIKHAYKGRKKENIDLVIEIDFNKLTIIITDQGVGFDVDKILNRDMKEYLAQMKVGGLGIHLIKSLMDDVEFKSQPGEKTEVRMTKYFVKDGKIEGKQSNE
ncbi:MAG: ATP-binding protein [Calditrichaeota bacterium]|nr:ATP-binding protein [Calditrichota bacterium]